MDLYKLKSHELKSLLEKGEVKSEEIVSSFLERIEDVDPKVSAFLYVDKKV